MANIVRKPSIPTFVARRNGNSQKMFQSVSTPTPDAGRAAAVKVTPPYGPGSERIKGAKDLPIETHKHTFK